MAYKTPITLLSLSRLLDSKVPEHLADPPVHTGCNRNSWRMEQPSKRIHHRTWETYNHCHRGNKRDKLYLSASLSGNSERQHAVFLCVFHHRHGLILKTITVMIMMIIILIIILITRDSVLKMLQMTKDTKEFIFFACVRFPLDFHCIFVVVLI